MNRVRTTSQYCSIHTNVPFFPRQFAFFLQELYPSTGGVVPTLDRPVIVLIVRTARRGLKNNDDVGTNAKTMILLREP